MNISDKTGSLAGLLSVNQTDDLMITCKSGLTIRMKVENVREAGRATQGVKLINLDAKDQIAAIARISEQNETEEILEEGEETPAVNAEDTSGGETPSNNEEAGSADQPEPTTEA
ncbi:DNA gyrase subunit A [compost metagenome]